MFTMNWLGSPFLDTRCFPKQQQQQQKRVEKLRGINLLLLKEQLKRRTRGKLTPGHAGTAGGAESGLPNAITHPNPQHLHGAKPFPLPPSKLRVGLGWLD